MIKLPKRIQGTDGIRGKIGNLADFNRLNSLEVCVKEGVLTEEFFELYAYAYASLLLSSGSAQAGDSIVIGWDPRDVSGKFNQAGINGILKAGLNVVKVGILPTPAIPLYMLDQNAAGSMVLTASHNPADQNGIKVFQAGTGLKFLPGDDHLLTEKLAEFQNLDLSILELKGNITDKSEEAAEFFTKFSQADENTWFAMEDFSQTVLVIDGSKGAVSNVVKPIFDKFKFNQTHFTNLSVKGDVNENCGVADIEGREFILPEEVLNETGLFYKYETMQTMFKLARENEEIKTGDLKLTGLVFDGDGDRCFRLDYLPEEDKILISTGDDLGIHQAEFLKNQENSKQGWFVNTVESDLECSITAEKMGFNSVITGVGDKWILFKAVADHIRESLLAEGEADSKILELLEQEEKSFEPSALEISKLWKERLTKGFTKKAEFNFQLGFEESGHCISEGIVSDKIRAFAGNGIKAGINALVSIESNYGDYSDSDFFDTLKHPFSYGVQKTFYVYYVNKHLLEPGSELRTEIADFLLEKLQEDYKGEMVDFPEESSMLYCQINNSEGEKVGAVFVRNSGTEDKSALYLRGDKKIEELLISLGDELHKFLLKRLKNQENEITVFEREVLNLIKNKSELNSLLEKYSNLPTARILKEIELKQGLVTRADDQLVLTSKGQSLID